MAQYIDAGKLDKPLWVLELKETADYVWEWVPVRKAWANLTLTTKSNLFSKVGVGARDAVILLRRQSLTLHNALRWKDQHLFVSAILEHGRNHLEVSAALVTMVACKAKRTADTMGPGNRPQTADVLSLSFPAVLTEKYAKYQREETFDAAETSYVLVTPKAILLEEGDLVTVTEGSAAGTYHLTIRHVLDEYKNEYEIVRRGDL